MPGFLRWDASAGVAPWKARRSATARLVLQAAESATFRPRPDAAKRLLDDCPTPVLSNKPTLRSCCVGSDRTSVSGFPTQQREVHGGGNHTILGPVFIDTEFPLLCIASSCETVVVPMAVSVPGRPPCGVTAAPGAPSGAQHPSAPSILAYRFSFYWEPTTALSAVTALTTMERCTA